MKERAKRQMRETERWRGKREEVRKVEKEEKKRLQNVTEMK